MRHQVKKNTLGRKKGPRELMLRNLASSIIIYEKVKTTEAKAKAVRSVVEKVITKAKKGDLAARRQIISILPQANAVKKAMDVLGQRYKDRAGGYTRIVRLSERQGDGAKMVQIELV